MVYIKSGISLAREGHGLNVVKSLEKRIKQEKNILALMVYISCKGHNHKGRLAGGVCPECQDLIDYSFVKIGSCKKGLAKTFCSECDTNCYAPQERESIRQAMRYAGPRMIFHRPLMAIRHAYSMRKKNKAK
ncbi:MAG: nitrous oxide-stimulated promoter family protein [Eggerthellaceae bacterium]|nr:nitrous oxide-stimulated promoter family protein [Eggerthellaceae bacterium]